MKPVTVFFQHEDLLPLFAGQRSHRFGGAERALFDLACALATRDDVDVRILSTQPVHEYAYEGITFEYIEPAIQRGVPVLSRALNARRRCKPFGQGSRRVMIQTIATPQTARIADVAREAGAKFVYRVSCDADLDGSFFVDDDQKNRFIETLADADGIIAQNQYQADQIEKRYGRVAHVVESGIAVPRRVAALERDLIVWIGRCVALKRPWHFLELARAFPEEQFVMLLGSDDAMLKRWIMQDATTIGNLRIVEDATYAQTWEYLDRAKLFVGTSAIEGSPITYLQAMAAKAPIVSLAHDRGLVDAGVVQCASDDMEQFKAMIKTTLDEDESREAQARIAAEYFDDHHSMDVCVSGYLRLLRTLFDE